MHVVRKTQEVLAFEFKLAPDAVAAAPAFLFASPQIFLNFSMNGLDGVRRSKPLKRR